MAFSDLGGFYTAQKAREIAKGRGGASNDVLMEIQRIQSKINEAAKAGDVFVSNFSAFSRSANRDDYATAWNRSNDNENTTNNRLYRSSINDVIGYFTRLGYKIELTGNFTSSDLSQNDEAVDIYPPFLYAARLDRDSLPNKDALPSLTPLVSVPISGGGGDPIKHRALITETNKDTYYDVYLHRSVIDNAPNGYALSPGDVIVGFSSNPGGEPRDPTTATNVVPQNVPIDSIFQSFDTVHYFITLPPDATYFELEIPAISGSSPFQWQIEW